MTAVALSPNDLDRILRSPGWRRERVEVFDTADGKVMAKGLRPPRHPARYQLLNALARLVGVPFLEAAPMHGGVRAQQVELARLQALHAAGAHVPRVLHVADDHFIMQWLGREHLGTVLQAGHPRSVPLWRECGDALLQLHAGGQYLSQGFARNMIVDTLADPPRLAGMIDFEDDPLEVMPLADAQARDWLAFLQSTLWTLPLAAADADAQLDAWLAAERRDVRQTFLRASHKLGWLRHLPRWRRLGKDTLAVQAAGAAAHRYAQRHSAFRFDS